jgi:hypothetical protein
MKNTRGRHPATTAVPLAHGVLAKATGGRARPTPRPEGRVELRNDPFANTQPGSREYREQQQIREAWEARQAPEVANTRNLQQQANNINFTFTPATPRLGPQR